MAGDGRDAAFGVARRRAIEMATSMGFWIFLLSNLLWVACGWYAHAYALIVLQFGLAVLNIRGVAKNERAKN